MSLQQVVQPRSSANGFGRRKVEREPGARLQNKLQSGKTNPSNLVNAGLLNGSKAGGYESPSRDRLLYLTTCLIGHNVEVQVKSGSIFSGIFHAANVEKDFGIILRMARLKKDCSFKGQMPGVDSVSIAPSKTMIVPAKELVQVIAKGVPVTEDGLTRVQGEKRQEIMTDSIISQSHFFEVERELERWTPDEDYPQCPGLENIFDGSWNRNWDQFETNETLFGVKSTFDEELYTTKLERGPQTRELEREALRIAREIEGEETQDLHLAEERGLHLHENFDIDEETRFSSVCRTVDDSGHEESEVMTLNSCNAETFGISSGPLISRTFSDVTRKKSDNGAHASSSSSSLDETQSFQSNGSKYLYRSGSGSGDHDRQPGIGCASKSLPASDSTSRTHEKQLHECLGGKNFPKEFSERITITEEAQTSNSKDVGTEASVPLKKAISNKVGLSPSAAAYAPSCVSSKVHENTVSQVESTDSAVSGKTCGMVRPGNSQGRPDSSTSATSECVGGASASSGPDLSPSSSVGSFSSEKSALNPHAKEFKFNPNAKSFTPSRTPLRPPSPVSEGSFYFPTNASSIPHGMPVGIGIGPPYAQQPVIINPQNVPMQSPQPFIHPSGPMYQQMILGHPRQVMYMPSYPPEMPYK